MANPIPSIITSIPSTFMTPGTTVELDITSGTRGVVALQRHAALIGVRITGAGTAVNGQPYPIFSDTDGDRLFGRGSELALLCRAARRAGGKANKSPMVWAIAIAEPAGVKSARTLTVAGGASTAGNVNFRIAGRYLSAPVATGDVAATIAASMKAVIDALAATGDLPGTATVAGAVVTFTAAQAGVNGEDIRFSVDSAPAGVTVAVATPSGGTGTGAAAIQPALDALVDKQYSAIVTANHTAADITVLAAYLDARSAPGVKKWSYAFLGVPATLAASTTLATAANKEYVVVVACEDSPSLPGELATHVAVTRLGVEDPSLSISGTTLDLYAPPGPSVFTPGVGGEVEAALRGGVTPLAVREDGSVYIVRLVTTKTTHNGAPYDTLRDFGVIYTLTWVAEQADIVVRIFMSDPKNKKMTLATQKRLRSNLLEMLREGEALGYLQNVDAHKGELQVGPDPSVRTRLNYALPASVVPGFEQGAGVVTLFLENALAA